MARKKAVRKTTSKSTAPRRNYANEQLAESSEIINGQTKLIAQLREQLRAAQHAAQAQLEADTQTTSCSSASIGQQLGFMNKRDSANLMTQKSSPSAPQPQLPIRAAVEDLHLELNDLTASFSQLATRLEPLLSPPLPPGDAPNGAEVSCSMEGQLRSAAAGIRSTTGWVNETLRRLML